MSNPRATLERLYQERYPEAQAIFWAGSVEKGLGTAGSDLDIVVVYNELPNAYREAFTYEGWPIDAFIHDVKTLRYFFEEIDTPSGMPALPVMIVTSTEITKPSHFSQHVKQLALGVIEAGAPIWGKKTIDKERFLITDIVEDILTPRNHAEQIASAAQLYEILAQFYCRAQGKWCASGKSLLRLLEKYDTAFSVLYSNAFDDFFKHGNTLALESLVQQVLKPYGGYLRDGFVQDAPEEWRKK
jgi:hypothetical protein